jgi:hypothetical protein
MNTLDFEKMLAEEARQKKQAGRGVYSRASRTGRKKGFMPHELLHGKEKREYTKSSEVVIYHIDKEGNRID